MESHGRPHPEGVRHKEDEEEVEKKEGHFTFIVRYILDRNQLVLVCIKTHTMANMDILIHENKSF